MGVQFEWQAGSDDGQWETIARAGGDPRRRWFRRTPWWVWIITVLVFAGLSALGYVHVRRRYEEFQRHVEFQIQGVIDLEARAFASGDADLFLDQQDQESSEWYAQQVRRVRENCSAPASEEGAVRDPCTPVLPAGIEDVDLHGDVAWVQVIEGQSPVRKVRFYRQTDLGWKHTAPRIEFWKTAIRIQYGSLFVQYHKRDMPQIVFLEEQIALAHASVCATTLCPAINTLTVDFNAEPPAFQSPFLVADPEVDGQDRLVLSSPWLSGIPVQGTWDEDYVAKLTHSVAYATTTRAMRSTTRRELNPLRESVADEYAAWYAGAEPAQLPLLGPIIAQRGEQVVPALLRSAKESSTLDQFLGRWLSLSLSGQETDPERARAYFEALLSLERRALLAGRKKTFLMVQDTTWWSMQERYYDRAQRDLSSLPRGPVRVRTAQVLGDHARVELEEPLPALQGQAQQTTRNMVYLRREDGDWRHANVLDAFFWTLVPTPTPSAASRSPAFTPIPTPSS
jgi:hypothetical protein